MNEIYDGAALLQAKRDYATRQEADKISKVCRGCKKSYRGSKNWKICPCEAFKLCPLCRLIIDLRGRFVEHMADEGEAQTV